MDDNNIMNKSLIDRLIDNARYEGKTEIVEWLEQIKTATEGDNK